MNTKRTKKGFTIVELVIVIAVIAVLAAVLIPTFANLVKKANVAADTALAKQLNTTIAMSDKDVDKFEDALEALREGGFLIANLNAKADGCYFVWEDETNQIIYVDAKNDFEVIYSNGTYQAIGDTWYLAVSNKAKFDEIKALNNTINVKMTIANTKDLNTAINATGTNTVYIDESIVIDEKSTIVMNNGSADVTIELGNATVSGNNSETLSIENVPFILSNGKLTLKGGVISATGASIDADGKVINSAIFADGGILTVDGAKLETPMGEDNKTLVSIEGATVTIKDTDIVSGNNVVNVNNGSSVNVQDTNVECAYLAVFASGYAGKDDAGNTKPYVPADVTIDGGTYTSTEGNLLAVIYGSTITIEKGTFTSVNGEGNVFKLYDQAGNKIILKGGTFNGTAFANLTEAIIRDMTSHNNMNNNDIKVSYDEVEDTWTIETVAK